MIDGTLWEQHRRTFKVAGGELRYLRFIDYCRANAKAGLTTEDVAFFQRLQTKAMLSPGQEFATKEELQRQQDLMRRWPVLDTWAACFVYPVLEDGAQLTAWLAQLPLDDRITLRLWLQELADPSITGDYGREFLSLIGAVGLPVAKDLDLTVITVQQALALFGQAQAALAALQQQREAKEG